MYVICCKPNTDLKVVLTKPVGIDVTLCNCVFGGPHEMLMLGFKTLDFGSIILLLHSETKLLSMEESQVEN
jgi:hypothetical protein